MECMQKFNLPKNFLFCGASQSGKSCLISRLLLDKDRAFNPIPTRIIYCYTAWQSAYEDLQLALGGAISFRTDIPTQEELTDLYTTHRDESILVLDDKLSVLRNDATGRTILDIFTVLSHHCHVSCLFTMQSMFHNQMLREISLNCHYIFLFRNNRSYQQIRTLGSQIMPRSLGFFLDSYDKATRDNYCYLLIDLCPSTDDKLRLKAHALPDEDLIVYLPRK